MQDDLFGADALPLPEGMVYEPGFLDAREESQLARLAARLPLKEMNYKGYTARRRVVSYGGKYDFEANRLESAAPIPPELEPLRAKVAAWLGVPPTAFTQVLVAEYREGTPLGWHRDVPDFEDVVGVSLLNVAVMRFRSYPPREAGKAGIFSWRSNPDRSTCCAGPRAGPGNTASRPRRHFAIRSPSEPRANQGLVADPALHWAARSACR